MSFYLYARRSGAAAGCPVIPFAAGCFLGLGFILGTMHIRETSVVSSDERHTLYLGSNKSMTCRHAANGNPNFLKFPRTSVFSHTVVKFTFPRRFWKNTKGNFNDAQNKFLSSLWIA
jgi:hypothetical protein